VSPKLGIIPLRRRLSRSSTVCTENLDPDVVVMKSAKDSV
jgi:hypothetical protein